MGKEGGRELDLEEVLERDLVGGRTDAQVRDPSALPALCDGDPRVELHGHVEGGGARGEGQL